MRWGIDALGNVGLVLLPNSGVVDIGGYPASVSSSIVERHSRGRLDPRIISLQLRSLTWWAISFKAVFVAVLREERQYPAVFESDSKVCRIANANWCDERIAQADFGHIAEGFPYEAEGIRELNTVLVVDPPHLDQRITKYNRQTDRAGTIHIQTARSSSTGSTAGPTSRSSSSGSRWSGGNGKIQSVILCVQCVNSCVSLSPKGPPPLGCDAPIRVVPCRNRPAAFRRTRASLRPLPGLYCGC